MKIPQFQSFRVRDCDVDLSKVGIAQNLVSAVFVGSQLTPIRPGFVWHVYWRKRMRWQWHILLRVDLQKLLFIWDTSCSEWTSKKRSGKRKGRWGLWSPQPNDCLRMTVCCSDGGGPKRFHESFNIVICIVGECISCAADTHLAPDLTLQSAALWWERLRLLPKKKCSSPRSAAGANSVSLNKSKDEDLDPILLTFYGNLDSFVLTIDGILDPSW